MMPLVQPSCRSESGANTCFDDYQIRRGERVRGKGDMEHRNYGAGVLGRFISRDPIGHAGNLNLYAYPTNPVSYADESGLQPTDPDSGFDFPDFQPSMSWDCAQVHQSTRDQHLKEYDAYQAARQEAYELFISGYAIDATPDALGLYFTGKVIAPLANLNRGSQLIKPRPLMGPNHNSLIDRLSVVGLSPTSPSGALNVVSHTTYDVANLARMIQSSANYTAGQTVNLVMCNGGPTAQALSNLLKAPVRAVLGKPQTYPFRSQPVIPKGVKIKVYRPEG